MSNVILFNNHGERDYYIENRIWQHIIKWLLYLVMPFVFIYIITYFKFIEQYNNSKFIIAFGLLLIIIFAIIIIIYYLLKECDKLISDLKRIRVSKNANDY